MSTGGGNGVGRGVALLMAELGARVVVNDIGRDAGGVSAAEKVVAEIARAGGEAVASGDSVATAAGAASMVGKAVERFGGVDILVCCAGNMIRKPTLELTDQDWDAVVGVHLKGHFNCIKAAAPEMVKRKGGRIICVSSRAAAGPGGCAAYSAAKAGILGLTSALAMEWKPQGITVNALIPSADTQLFPGERPKPPPGHRGLPASLERPDLRGADRCLPVYQRGGRDHQPVLLRFRRRHLFLSEAARGAGRERADVRAQVLESGR